MRPLARPTPLVLLLVAACASEPPPPATPCASVAVAAPPSPTPSPSPSLTPTPSPAPTLAPAPSPPPLTDAYAPVHGLKMHYFRQGTGPTLVLLQGGTTSAMFSWGKALPFFTPTFDVILPDQMGHGGTADDPKRPFDYHQMAEDTAELLAQLGVTTAYFIGWSDGGNLALDLAMHHPALTKKIVTSGANMSPDGMLPQVVKVMREAKHPLADSPFFADVKADYAKVSPDGAAHFGPFVERLKTMWLSKPNWTAKDLGTIHVPALIMAGDQDVIRLEHTAAIARAIPDSRLAILPHEEHGAMIDRAPWNEMVLAFLQEPIPPQSASPAR